MNAEAIGSFIARAALNNVVPTLPLDDDVMALAQRFEIRLSQALSTALRERPRKAFSLEHRAKLSEALRGNSRTKGRRLSADHVAKVAAALRGRKLSDVTRARMSAARLGKPGHEHDAETKAKIAAAHRGKPVSVATRAKIAAAVKGQWSDPASRATLMSSLKASAEARAKLKPRPIAEPKQPVVTRARTARRQSGIAEGKAQRIAKAEAAKAAKIAKAERRAVAKLKPPKVAKALVVKPAAPKPKQRAALDGFVRSGWAHYVDRDFDNELDTFEVLEEIGLRKSVGAVD